MAWTRNKLRKTLWLGVIVSFVVLGTVTTGVAQTLQEPTESIRLYSELVNDRVPVVSCIDLERSGRLLAIGGDDHFVRLWDINARGVVMTLQEHLDWVRGLAFNSDRSRLATIGQDGQIKLWSVQDGSLQKVLKDPVRGTRRIVFQPNSTRFAVCGFDSNVRIYDASTGALVATLPAHGGNNEAIVYSPDGSLLAAAGRTGVIRVWRTSNHQQLADIRVDNRRINALAFSQDAKILASAGDGPFIILASVDGKSVKTLPERPGKTHSLAFCGSNTLASGESDNVIRLWNLQTGKQISTLMGHTGTISTMVYEPTTNRLITGSFDTTVKIWHVSGGGAQLPVTLETAKPTGFSLPTTTPTTKPAITAPASPTSFANPIPQQTATPGRPTSF